MAEGPEARRIPARRFPSGSCCGSGASASSGDSATDCSNDFRFCLASETVSCLRNSSQKLIKRHFRQDLISKSFFRRITTKFIGKIGQMSCLVEVKLEVIFFEN